MGKPTPGLWKRYKDSIHPSFDGPSPHTTNGDRVICDLFGPDKALNAFLILAANEAHEACEKAGYDGLEAVKALPEVLEALRPALAVAAYLDRPAGHEPDDRTVFEAAAVGIECALTAGDIRRMARLHDRLQGPRQDQEGAGR